MRESRPAYSFARSLPVITRQPEQRRLMYCHINSVNSGCALFSAYTLVSGVTALITRSYVCSEMPRLRARGLKVATQRVKAGGCVAQACPRVAMPAAMPRALVRTARLLRRRHGKDIVEIRCMALV